MRDYILLALAFNYRQEDVKVDLNSLRNVRFLSMCIKTSSSGPKLDRAQSQRFLQAESNNGSVESLRQFQVVIDSLNPSANNIPDAEISIPHSSELLKVNCGLKVYINDYNPTMMMLLRCFFCCRKQKQSTA
ncbi:hypothetical protein GQX74_002163 [Glossina fuscipes]|nr:hypothetical protein GQX74_002163 [Glossina fuscipes]